MIDDSNLEWRIMVDELRQKLYDERRAHAETRAKADLWGQCVLRDSTHSERIEAASAILMLSDPALLKIAIADAGLVFCTPAERKVLDAWGKVPEALLRTVHKMPIHLFEWLLTPCESELVRRGEKT